jgi:hypothetical protein
LLVSKWGENKRSEVLAFVLFCVPMAPPVQVQAEINLEQGKYQSSVSAYRTLLEDPANKNPHLLIGLRAPDNSVVELQVRHEDAYVIGFKGADGWYVFDDQKNGWGKPCGVKSNYNQLGEVGTVVLKDLNRLGELGQFKKGTSTLDKRLCAILFAVTSEAARFATVATYFTGMTNGLDALKGGVNFEYLKTTYFNNWANPPEQQMEVGKVYHFRKSDILVPRYRK